MMFLRDIWILEKDYSIFLTTGSEFLEDRRHAEFVADSRSSQGDPKVPFSDMLKQVARTYTPSIYKIFKAGYYLFLNCSIRDNGQSEKVHEYIVTNGRREWTVRHDLHENNITCTCLKFEFMEIQCCHVIKALDFMNIKQLPEKVFFEMIEK
jgi:zinc finger SWIM domain-containing protein 3